MRYFDGFAERENVRSVVDRAMESDAVQGVVFELDPAWLVAWRLSEHGILKRWDFLMGYRWPRSWRIPELPALLGMAPFWIPARVPTGEDLQKWRPPFWKEYQEETWGVQFDWPVIIKICLKPPDQKSRVDIPRLEDERLNIVYETRPRARLFAGSTALHRPLVGGTSIGVDTVGYGTLGGLVTDGAGKYYGVTCAHVASAGQTVFHPARADSQRAQPIGKVVADAGLKLCPTGSPCSWRATGNYVNDLDVALIEIDSSVATKLDVFKIGGVTLIRPGNQLVQGMSVQLTGRSSGHKASLELGGNGKYYKIPDGQGREYCVRNIIELKEPSYYRNCFGSPVDDGDSGTWVCAPGPSGNDWCAMVIGGDRFTGFAIESESIQDWWSNPPNQLKLAVI